MGEEHVLRDVPRFVRVQAIQSSKGWPFQYSRCGVVADLRGGIVARAAG